MKAKSSEQYREAWESHVRELTCVFLEAEIPLDQWPAIQQPLYDAIDQAVVNLEEQETWKTPSN